MNDTIKIGTKLLFVGKERWRDRRSELKEVTVTKVGRKWLTLDNGMRAHRLSLWVDGGDYASPGSLWFSADEYEAHERLTAAWSAFHSLVSRRYSPPAGVTLSQVENAKRALFKERT